MKIQFLFLTAWIFLMPLIGAEASDRLAHFGEISHQESTEQTSFKKLHADEIQFLKNQIALFADFPLEGILFQDFSPILRNNNSFRVCIDLMCKWYSDKGVEAIIGLESRGFIIGGALAYALNVPFIPVRKAGKIPGPVFTIDYEKEYGKDSFCIAQDAIKKGQKILVVDDLIATGGSAIAAIELIKLSGGEPMEFFSLLEIKELEGRQKLGIPSFNLID